MKFIEIKNLSFSYLKKGKESLILKDINLSLEKGKIYYIIGESGAGKTTLIQLIGLIKSIKAGTYFYKNKDLTKLSDKDASFFRNKKIGFIFQDYYLLNNLTVLENIALPLIINSKVKLKSIKNDLLNLISLVNLNGKETCYPNQLSGGEKQRVAIARALINDPEIILADEPISSLDNKNADDILKILKKLAKKDKCVIIVSHNQLAYKYADYVYILNDKNLKLKEKKIL